MYPPGILKRGCSAPEAGAGSRQASRPRRQTTTAAFMARQVLAEGPVVDDDLVSRRSAAECERLRPLLSKAAVIGQWQRLQHTRRPLSSLQRPQRESPGPPRWISISDVLKVNCVVAFDRSLRIAFIVIQSNMKFLSSIFSTTSRTTWSHNFNVRSISGPLPFISIS